MSGEYLEQIVCKKDDLKNNDMKAFPFGDGKVLLVKQNNVLHAIGTKCTHYGAPLEKGALLNGFVRCPWHGACFNIENGDLEDFPGLDSIPVYQVSIDGDDVKVKANKSDLAKNSRTKTLCKRNAEDKNTIVIIGGGPASTQCAETLRQEGFTGRLVLVTEEKALPYDRTKLSKALSTKADDLILRTKEYLDAANIEIVLQKVVKELNVKDKTVTLDDGSKINYSKVFVGTGSSPRKMDVKGSDLKNIFYLRTSEDANTIAEQIKDKNVVIIGTSFIGMEVGAFANGKAKTVTIVGKGEFPFGASLGNAVGEQFQKLYESKGIKLIGKANVTQFKGDGVLQEVVLDNNQTLPADICVIGIGTIPNTQFLKNSDIKLDNRGCVLVDATFKSSASDVFAGGDVVTFPLPMANNELVNIGHWQIAQSHGKYAALSMLGKKIENISVPFFWSMLFGKGIRFSGYSQGYDDIHLVGDLEQFKCIVYYLKKDTVIAVATIGAVEDPVAAMFSLYINKGKQLGKSDIKQDPQEWINANFK